MTGRLKFYGWGARRRGSERGRAGPPVRLPRPECLGVEPRSAAPPADPRSPWPRRGFAAPAALAGVLTAEPYERLRAHLWEVVPGDGPGLRRAISPTRPTSSPTRATRPRWRPCIDWASGAQVAVIPFGGGSSRGRRGRAAPSAIRIEAAVTPRPARTSTACSKSTGDRTAARSRRGILGPAMEAAAQTPRLDASATFRKASSIRRSAAGSPPARAAISQPSTPISTTSSKACAW